MLVFWVIRCGSKEDVVQNAPPKVEVVTAPIKREPGSLWSENSRWNEIYSLPSTRSVGDVVFIKPTEAFKRVLVSRLQSPSPGDAKKTTTDIVKAEPQIDLENVTFAATIKEVQRRGIYRVSSEQRFTLGQKEKKLLLEGNIRERDIGSDDMVGSDLFYSVNLLSDEGDPRKKENK